MKKHLWTLLVIFSIFLGSYSKTNKKCWTVKILRDTINCNNMRRGDNIARKHRTKSYAYFIIKRTWN